MKKLLFALFGLLAIVPPASAAFPIFGTVQISTDTTYAPALQTGAFNVSSGTVLNLLTSTATISAATIQNLTASSATLSNVQSITGSTIAFSSASFTGINSSTGTFLQVTVTTATVKSSFTVSGISLFSSTTTLGGALFDNTNLTAGTSGQMLVSRGGGSPPFWTSGRILQIVQYSVTTTSNVTTAFSGFINSPVQPQITPLSTGSTIYIFGSIESNVHNVAAGTGVASFKWTRGLFGTNLHASYGDWAGGGSGTSVANDTWRQGPLFDWDSPASLSQQTYVVQFECNGSGGASTCYINEASFVTPASTVFLVEIGPT